MRAPTTPIEPTPHVPRLRIQYGEQPIHCIDVLNGIGELVLRVRRGANGTVDLRAYGERMSSMTRDEAQELAPALDKLASSI